MSKLPQQLPLHALVSTTMSTSPISLSDTEPPDGDTQTFIPSEWIRCGKTYPASDTPPFILAARNAILAIPLQYRSLVPNPKGSVLYLLSADLPHRPSALTLKNTSHAFSDDPPNETLTTLTTRPIPHPEFISKLQSQFGQAWFSGAQSIKDEQYKHSRLPFYAIEYWMQMAQVLDRKAAWIGAESWLGTWEAKDDALLLEALKVRLSFSLLAWGLWLKALGTDTGAETLAILLSDAWLNDEHINMMFEWLYYRARRDPKLASTVVLLPVVFQSIAQNAVKKNDYTHRLLKQCERYANVGRTQFYFPVNIGNSHWLPFHIDLSQATIRWGERRLLSPQYISQLT